MNEVTEEIFEEILLWSGEDEKLMSKLRKLEELILEEQMEMKLKTEVENESQLSH